MKKLLPLLLTTSLLLSACSIDWNDEDDTNFVLQSKCSEKSKELFKEFGNTERVSIDKDGIMRDASFENFYHKKMGICFALFTVNNSYSNTLGDKIRMSNTRLYDVGRKKMYGNYSENTGNSDLEDSIQCDFIDPKNNKKIDCKWYDEFQKLIKPYIDN